MFHVEHFCSSRLLSIINLSSFHKSLSQFLKTASIKRVYCCLSRWWREGESAVAVRLVFFKWDCALVARGMFFLLVKRLALRAGQRQGGVFRLPPPYLWTPLSPQRVKGCSPLTIPKRKSKPKNASRFAKRIFLCFSHLRLRRRFHVSAGRYRQQRGNTSCEAANRRNEKKAFSEAASFFPFRPLLRGLKGASSPFLVDPARRNRWCFSGSLLARKRELSSA